MFEEKTPYLVGVRYNYYLQVLKRKITKLTTKNPIPDSQNNFGSTTMNLFGRDTELEMTEWKSLSR